ncbi:MAG: hypothetical protein AABZ14_06935, partial [Candidatus Margulisiibacteriota bacterium]
EAEDGDKATILESKQLQSLVMRYAQLSFKFIQNMNLSGEPNNICLELRSVLIRSGMLSEADADIFVQLAKDKALAPQTVISESIRTLLGGNPFSRGPSVGSERLINRFKNLSFFGTEGLMWAVKEVQKLYARDPKNIAQTHLDSLASMGIRFNEKDLEGFMNLCKENFRVIGVISPDDTFNTIPLILKGDLVGFIHDELEKFQKGLNPFTGPLAKTFMDTHEKAETQIVVGFCDESETGSITVYLSSEKLGCIQFPKIPCDNTLGIDSYDELIYTINDALQKAGSKPKTIEDRDTLLDTLAAAFRTLGFQDIVVLPPLRN